MTTLITTIAIFALTAGCVWAYEKAKRAHRKSSRANVRRIQRYLDQLPPAHPYDRAPW